MNVVIVDELDIVERRTQTARHHHYHDEPERHRPEPHSVAMIFRASEQDAPVSDEPSPTQLLDVAKESHGVETHANMREAIASVVSPTVWVGASVAIEAVQCIGSMVPSPIVRHVEVRARGDKHFVSALRDALRDARFVAAADVDKDDNADQEPSSPSSSSSSFVRAHDEQQYMHLVRRIMVCGDRRTDRTGTGTYSVWGAQLRFSLFDGTLPLLTTKRTFWKGVREELLWFIEGCTDAHVLRDRGVHIWDANGSRAFLDSRGLTHYDEGMLGPVYGRQWRHFNAPYCGVRCSAATETQAETAASHGGGGGGGGGAAGCGSARGADGGGGSGFDVHAGVDQLRQCIDELRRVPDTRRCLMTAWNPEQVAQMALPPCHVLCQFSVRRGRYLVAQLYQRSADVGLGLPFNIASYALLTHLVAHVAGYEAAELIVTLGDAHLYADHIAPIRASRLLDRAPFPFPSLTIVGKHTCIDDVRSEHLLLHDYRAHPAVKLPFSA